MGQDNKEEIKMLALSDAVFAAVMSLIAFSVIIVISKML